jgi:hypothetical protein
MYLSLVGIVLILVLWGVPSLIKPHDSREMTDYYFRAMVGNPCGGGFSRPERIGPMENVVSNAMTILGYNHVSEKWDDIGKAFFKVQKNTLIIRISLYTIWEIDELRAGDYRPEKEVCESASELALLYALTVMGPEIVFVYASLEVTMTIITGQSPTEFIIDELSARIYDVATELGKIPDYIGHLILDTITDLF